jgi:predicted kinase
MDLSKFNALDVVLVAGLPGSGKSHFAKINFQDTGRKRVNRKEIRRSLYEMTHFGKKWKEEYFHETDESLVKHVERKILEQLLQTNQKVLIDNTSVTVSSRKNYVGIVHNLKRTIGIVFLKVPLRECLKRNESREDSVPGIVISNLAAAMVLPETGEGYKEVLIVGS